MSQVKVIANVLQDTGSTKFVDESLSHVVPSVATGLRGFHHPAALTADLVQKDQVRTELFFGLQVDIHETVSNTCVDGSNVIPRTRVAAQRGEARAVQFLHHLVKVVQFDILQLGLPISRDVDGLQWDAIGVSNAVGSLFGAVAAHFDDGICLTKGVEL